MIIVALDVESAQEARSIVSSLGDSVSFYKVGLELYASAGMDFVRELKSQGHRVFLDLKLYDIPETVRRAVVQIARSGVDFLTIGQYLQPTRRHAAVDRFVHPEEFAAYEAIARAKGFLMVSASPLTRSSHHAGEDFARLREARALALGSA